MKPSMTLSVNSVRVTQKQSTFKSGLDRKRQQFGAVELLERGPRIAEVEISTQCDNGPVCVWCPNHTNPERAEKQTVMGMPLFEKIMQDLSAMGTVKFLRLHGYNEPLLLDEQLNAFVQKAKQILPLAQIQIYSNGNRATETNIGSLLDDGVSKFLFTQYEKERGFLHTLENMPDDLLEKVSIRPMSAVFLSNRGGTLTRIKNVRTGNIPCTMPNEQMVIRLVEPNKANVVLCCEDYKQKTALGDVSEQSIQEIWELPKFKQIRRELPEGTRRLPLCQACNIIPTETVSFSGSPANAALTKKLLEKHGEGFTLEALLAIQSELRQQLLQQRQ